MLEADYKPAMLKRLVDRFSKYGPVRYLHNDPNLPGQQGQPDLTVYIGSFWCALEVKRQEKSRRRPNQEWWIAEWSKTTFAALISPETEEEVFNALERSLEARGAACISRGQ